MGFRILAVLTIGLAAVPSASAAPDAPGSSPPDGSPSAAPRAAPELLAPSMSAPQTLVPDHRPRLVSLTVAGDTKDSKETEAVVAELLGRLSVNVDFRRVEGINLNEIAIPRPTTKDYLACAYVDLRTPGTAILYLVDPIHDRVLVRRVEQITGSEEVAREQLGHILETSVEGLLAGMQIGMPRLEIIPTLVPQRKAAEESHSTAPPVASLAEPSFWHLSLLYEGVATSASTPIAHGPVLGVLGHRTIDRIAIGVWIRAQHRWSYDLDSHPVGARIGGEAIRMLATLDLREGTTWSWRFALGGGVDFVNVRPTASDSQRIALAMSHWLTFAVARAEIGARLRLRGAGHLLLDTFADVDPSGTNYVFSARSGLQVVMRPWTLRPGLSFGVELP